MSASSEAGRLTGHAVVSIGLPVHNGGPLLARALQSLVDQDYPHLEVVVRDNASTDETESIGRDFAARDPRVRYVRNETNIGAVANFARTLGDATGPYFMWAAHDDRWDPGYVRRLEAVLRRYPGVALAAGHALFEDSDGSSLGAESHAPRDASVPWQELLDWHATHWIYGLFVRHRLQQLTPRLWARCPWGGDMIWLMELVTTHAVAGDEEAVLHKTVKPSPHEPKAPRDVVAWQVWYGRELLTAVLRSPMPLRKRMLAARAVGAYWSRYVRRPGTVRLAMTWMSALREATLGRERPGKGT